MTEGDWAGTGETSAGPLPFGSTTCCIKHWAALGRAASTAYLGGLGCRRGGRAAVKGLDEGCQQRHVRLDGCAEGGPVEGQFDHGTHANDGQAQAEDSGNRARHATAER